MWCAATPVGMVDGHKRWRETARQFRALADEGEKRSEVSGSSRASIAASHSPNSKFDRMACDCAVPLRPTQLAKLPTRLGPTPISTPCQPDYRCSIGEPNAVAPARHPSMPDRAPCFWKLNSGHFFGKQHADTRTAQPGWLAALNRRRSLQAAHRIAFAFAFAFALRCALLDSSVRRVCRRVSVSALSHSLTLRSAQQQRLRYCNWARRLSPAWVDCTPHSTQSHQPPPLPSSSPRPAFL
ncbi:hypothetical protein L1887_57930 [Cichorium endivia]|nr:hypothetical protein L1887_57930 [Cichorium endivia]